MGMLNYTAVYIREDAAVANRRAHPGLGWKSAVV